MSLTYKMEVKKSIK